MHHLWPRSTYNNTARTPTAEQRHGASRTANQCAHLPDLGLSLSRYGSVPNRDRGVTQGWLAGWLAWTAFTRCKCHHLTLTGGACSARAKGRRGTGLRFQLRLCSIRTAGTAAVAYTGPSVAAPTGRISWSGRTGHVRVRLRVQHQGLTGTRRRARSRAACRGGRRGNATPPRRRARTTPPSRSTTPPRSWGHPAPRIRPRPQAVSSQRTATHPRLGHTPTRCRSRRCRP